MYKHSYFNSTNFEGWPNPAEVAPFFLGPSPRWFTTGGNDGGMFTAEGVDGSAHLPKFAGRIDLYLRMDGFPDRGVMLMYHKFGIGTGIGEARFSKGDQSLLRQHVRTLYGSFVPLGLIIPFEQAFPAVKEFLENDGRLPKSIAWVHSNDLPEGTFPLP
jgi:hypothetical protein